MKLTNNLTLDSQLEKYRALGFDKYRLSIIIAGLAKGLDVSHYAKISFNADKMCVIKSGLERGLDVSVYAKNLFNGFTNACSSRRFNTWFRHEVVC